MNQRNPTIDVLKGMLVFGMVLSHVASLISRYDGFPMKHIWLFTGLITFSGFVFSFGYVCQIAYFSKTLGIVYQRMLITALKPLIAFYISAIYWRAFVDKKLSFGAIADILLLNDIPPFSEFLVSFSLIILVSLLLFAPIQKVTASVNSFWIVFTLLLLTTLIPYSQITVSQLGLMIGTEKFPVYPVLQYFPIFLLGVYFARHKLIHDRKTALVSSLGIGSFLLIHFVNHQIPSRFPPSLCWIVASIFSVYLYYQIAQFLSKCHPVATLLGGWGKNVLFYLLMSNILIFTFRGAYEKVNLSPIGSFGLTLVMLFGINFLVTTISVPKPLSTMPASHAHPPVTEYYPDSSYEQKARINSSS
jgi:fucose 4-O-acetylase-like acetyltransferase